MTTFVRIENEASSAQNIKVSTVTGNTVSEVGQYHPGSGCVLYVYETQSLLIEEVPLVPGTGDQLPDTQYMTSSVAPVTAYLTSTVVETSSSAFANNVAPN